MVVSAPLLWLVLAALLLLLVLIGLESDGLVLITGLTALLLTVVTALVPLPPPLQVLLFVVPVALGYGWLRHWSNRQSPRAIPPAAMAELAEVIHPFDAHGLGRVRWQGQSWAALNLEPDRSLPAGAQVTVMGREGTQLRVLPR